MVGATPPRRGPPPPSSFRSLCSSRTHVSAADVASAPLLRLPSASTGADDATDHALAPLSRHSPLPSETYMSLLRACIIHKSSCHAKKVHAHIATYGTQLTGLLGDYLVVTLAKCGAIEDALQVLEALPRRTVFSWTALISSCAERGLGNEALGLYQQMQNDGVAPNHFTFVSLFQACGCIRDLHRAKQLHADANQKGLLCNSFVGNSLVSMYTKCGAIREAEDAFSMLTQRNVVTWNTLLSAYSQSGQAEKVLSLYRKMQEEGEGPDHLTITVALQSCGILADREKTRISKVKHVSAVSLIMGQTLHADACKTSHMSDVFVVTALVSMYAKCGAVLEAEVVFSANSHCDLASWNAMLTAYVEQGLGEKVLQLYGEMRKHSFMMDEITFTCCLQGCSETGCLNICRQLHFNIVCAGYDNIYTITASLINAYRCCANMLSAQVFFDTLAEPDYVTWTSCVFGHAGDGNPIASLCIFEQLTLVGMTPDEILLTTILTACSHAGLVPDGMLYFASLCNNYNISLNSKHYSIMLDLLGRAGDFERMGTILKRMPMRVDFTIWLSLLGMCQTHGHLEFAELAFDHVVRLQPNETYAYILMSNIYETEACKLKRIAD